MSSIDVIECFQLDFLISKDSAQFFTSIFSPFLCLLCRFHRKESIDGNTFLSLDFFFTLSLAHFFWEYSRNKKSHFFFFFIIIIIFFIGTRWFQVFTWLLPANTSNQLTRRKSVQIYGRFSFFFVCCYAGGQEVVVDFFFLPFSSFLFVFMRLTTPFGSTSSFDSFHFLSFFFFYFFRIDCDHLATAAIVSGCHGDDQHDRLLGPASGHRSPWRRNAVAMATRRPPPFHFWRPKYLFAFKRPIEHRPPSSLSFWIFSLFFSLFSFSSFFLFFLPPFASKTRNICRRHSNGFITRTSNTDFYFYFFFSKEKSNFFQFHRPGFTPMAWIGTAHLHIGFFLIPTKKCDSSFAYWRGMFLCNWKKKQDALSPWRRYPVSQWACGIPMKLSDFESTLIQLLYDELYVRSQRKVNCCAR